MDIGIGFPSTIPGIPGRLILEWASAAKQAGFSSLGTLKRIVYSNSEAAPTPAVAAAVTERIGLMTAILIGPCRSTEILERPDRMRIGRAQNGAWMPIAEV